MRFEYLEKFATRRFDFIDDRDCILVPIVGEEYDICKNPKIWSTSNRSPYKRGMLNTPYDKNKTERIGWLGECACGKIFDVEIDFSYINGGDGGIDFVLSSNLSCDVKTSSKGTMEKHGKNFIVAITDLGQEKELPADIYVGAFVFYDNKRRKEAMIALIGWMTRSQVINNGIWKAHPTENNPEPKHWNYEMPFHLQLPITDLVLGDREYKCHME